jgi:uncharacterized protein (DUF2252 family)
VGAEKTRAADLSDRSTARDDLGVPQGLSVRPQPTGRSDPTGAEVPVPFHEREAFGKAARRRAGRSSHATLRVPPDRRDPIGLLEEQARGRDPRLVSLRYSRMAVSPYAYYRGAAVVMASDLAASPTTGLVAQLCGDAHVANFGVFGSQHGGLFFDIADYDETAPGPWEWDVKRLAASVQIAGRESLFSGRERKEAVRGTLRSYREAMTGFAHRSMLEVWRSELDSADLLSRFEFLLDRERTSVAWHVATKAGAHESYRGSDQILRMVGDEIRISSDPPLVVPIEELGQKAPGGPELRWLRRLIRSYAGSLQPGLRHLLDEYRVAHLARHVTGVAGAASDTWIALLLDETDRMPLLLQIRRAEGPVLERFGSKGVFSNQAQRVVYGQRLIQVGSDDFLGWQRDGRDGRERDYYIRRLPDWRGSVEAAGITPAALELWGRMCGWTLARAHARTGDRIALASYLGRSDAFETAIDKFARSYADHNERDYEAFEKAVRKGRIVTGGIP